jgi:hypothetical protein
MAEQTETFPFSIGQKVTVVETTRDGWIAGLFVRPDGIQHFSVNTTKASGEPEQVWLFAAQITDFVEPV